MSRYTEKPMARAHEHLASARYAEAAGAFRAVLRIDPNEFQAHFGLADALVARGQRDEAVEGLVAAAESCTAREDHGAALTLYGKALAVDPMRLELHLDVAMAEAALGRMESAQQRLEHLAEVYMQAGRTDEAAEVYRCLAGWEGDGEDEEAAPEPAPPPARTTAVPTAPGRTAPHAAVPTMMPSTETVVIPTILVTPDGQLMQVPVAAQAGQPLVRPSDDSVPPLSAELLEVVHSAPIDLAAGEPIEEVERTVVAFPPPPPSLPEEYVSAAHTVNRAALEAAVVAAMDNLAQLEEEDMTLIMQRLPPQPKGGRVRTSTGESRLPEFVTRGRMVKPQLPAPEPEPDAELEPDDDLAADDLADEAVLGSQAEPAPDSKLRIKPAPRPVGKAAASAPAAQGPAAPASKLAASSKPAAAPVSKTSAPSQAGAPASKAAAASKPVVPASKPATATSKPAAAPTSRAGAASKPATATSKPATATSKPAVAPTSKPAAPASKPATAASKPAAAPTSKPATGASKVGGAAKPAPASAASKPAAPGAKPAAGKLPATPAVGGAKAPTAGPAARPSTPTPAPAGGAPAAKPTRPDNPLAERLRRRAGLQKPPEAPGRPSATAARPTEPITVRSPSGLPPVTKTKK